MIVCVLGAQSYLTLWTPWSLGSYYHYQYVLIKVSGAHS